LFDKRQIVAQLSWSKAVDEHIAVFRNSPQLPKLQNITLCHHCEVLLDIKMFLLLKPESLLFRCSCVRYMRMQIMCEQWHGQNLLQGARTEALIPEKLKASIGEECRMKNGSILSPV